ncbi:ABC transporter substrate-binding protein [Bradyrhizobium sp. LHD-71]|uniref:ABC transporter substrate-binding protein n=1 Tax=Bradyrhizobium sp. LHD-71 TaxID=3072141 RepID=UPI00280E7331|nr:ABC transporter substrate-binding protein [Bradyrhizobium sp. LHD-71]MDQ8727728.1 ABC transporter substrate-binding protein [Bradyrhizobium sp. LHD-71]
MRLLPFATWIAGAAVLALLLPTSAGAAQKIVSLNLCTDELLLRLADRPRIASVTWLSRDPATSNVAALAERVPVNYGSAEQVVVSNPDLVLAGTFTTRVTVSMLKRTAVPVVEFGVPRSLDEVRQQIRDVAALVQAEDKGKQLIDEINRRIDAVASKARAVRPTAVVLNPNGATVARGTLADQVMTAAGLENIAARLNIDNYGEIPLEMVALHQVDVLIVSASRDGPPSQATEMLRHPILSKLARTRIVVLPGRLWNCGGPGVAEAVERLDAVATDVVRGRS